VVVIRQSAPGASGPLGLWPGGCLPVPGRLRSCAGRPRLRPGGLCQVAHVRSGRRLGARSALPPSWRRARWSRSGRSFWAPLAAPDSWPPSAA